MLMRKDSIGIHGNFPVHDVMVKSFNVFVFHLNSEQQVTVPFGKKASDEENGETAYNIQLKSTISFLLNIYLKCICIHE